MLYIEGVATDEEWQRYREGWCLRCLGFCTCRACMRKPFPRAAYSPPDHQADEYARHVLRYVGPLLADQQRHKDKEVCIPCMSDTSKDFNIGWFKMKPARRWVAGLLPRCMARAVLLSQELMFCNRYCTCISASLP